MLPKIPRSDRNYIQILRQKSKGNEKGMSKTPKFSACGGLNSKNNSIIYSLSVKDGILITFEYKSPRSGEIFLKAFFAAKRRKIFGGVFFTQTQK